MSGYDDQAFGVMGLGTANTTAVLFTSSTVSQTNELPKSWGSGGYWLELTAIGDDSWYCFHDVSTGTISASVTATAAGAEAANLGGYLVLKTAKHVKVPTGHTFFARIGNSASATAVLVERRSGPGAQE